MKKFGDTVKIMFGALDIFPNAKTPACNFFQNNDQQAFGITSVSGYSTSFGRMPRQADTVQCRPSKKCKTPFAAVVEWPTVGVYGLE